ncbi:hypothetical protein BDR26DRAFT_891738 [Obelidium mucronatum]|nr:hypothetical protein BDR26DRAFT_891738 [Obelidium mucronatum]
MAPTKRKDNMSSDDGSSSDQALSHKDKELKGKAGRKPLPEDAVPANHQVARQRANQRAFRERKANELKTLQDEVKQLREKLENSSKTAAPPNITDSILLDRIAALESENLALKHFAFTFMKQTPTLTTPPVSMAPSSSFMFSDPLLTQQLLIHHQQQLQQQQGAPGTVVDPFSFLETLNASAQPSLASESPCPSIEDCITGVPAIPSSILADTTTAATTITGSTTIPGPSMDFSSFRESPTLTTQQDNDDLLDFLNSTTPPSATTTTATTTTTSNPTSTIQHPPRLQQEQRIPLAIKLELSYNERNHILNVADKLKTIPSLSANPSIVDDLCDAFATCSLMGYTPNHMLPEEEIGTCAGGEVEHVEKLKRVVMDACEARPEDHAAVQKILGQCKKDHP